MTQSTLFDDDDPGNAPEKPLPPKLPHNNTVTSKLAAQSMRCSAGAQQQRVLECLQQAGDAGLTDDEMQAALNLSGNSQRPRRRRLVELGLVADSQTMRKTGSSHAAIVWRVTRPEERQPVASKADWPLDSNPDKAPAEPMMIS